MVGHWSLTDAMSVRVGIQGIRDKILDKAAPRPKNGGGHSTQGKLAVSLERKRQLRELVDSIQPEFDHSHVRLTVELKN